jgi:pimeloyl-ACP methyl ester carboxylesterase
MIRRAIQGMAAIAGEGLDRAFLQFTFKSSQSGKRGARESVRDRLATAGEFYKKKDEEGLLFAEPAAAQLDEQRIRGLRGGQVLDVSWPSAYAAFHPDHIDTLKRCPENARCHARWFRHASPSPTIICLHGWAAGQFAIEERAYPVGWFYKIGLDVALVTLPFHARRLPAGRRTPMFPSPDPVRSTEGFAQAVSDVRAITKTLREHGAPAVGISGMSLGGYTTALLATVEPTIDFAIPMIPFASVPKLLWDHGAGTEARKRGEAAGMTLAIFSRAFEAISPLERPVAMDARRILLIAGKRDRVTPATEAIRLHRHFGGSKYETFPGAHIFQVGRSRAFRHMGRFLGELGVLPPR